MQQIEFFVPEVVSCEECQAATESPFVLGLEKFCSYKCGFRFVWHIIFGEVHDSFTWREGWSDSQIKAMCLLIWAKAFQAKVYARKDWAFQLSKHYVQELRQ